jgi:methionyl-tRNA synthetase
VYHPGKPVETVEEENYFFKLSKYQDQLFKLIDSDEYKIVPQARKNEVLGFIKSGLEDFSISRSVKRARGWGVDMLIPGELVINIPEEISLRSTNTAIRSIVPYQE